MKNYCITFFLLFTTMLSCFAQSTKTYDLWPNGAPNDNKLSGPVADRGDKFLSNISHPKIYAYIAKNPNGKAVIMCPGGGYAGVMMTFEGWDMGDWYNAQGISYFVLEYRMPNGHHEVPLSDAEQAIRFVRQHAAEWGINKNMIGISGASAGGHLAASLATLYSSEETRPDFQVLFYPVITTKDGLHLGSRNNLMGKKPSQELITRYNLAEQVNNHTPKAFIMLSADDSAVPPVANGIAFADSLIANKVPVSLHVYPTGGHGWGFQDAFKFKAQWTNELGKWLREEVK